MLKIPIFALCMSLLTGFNSKRLRCPEHPASGKGHYQI
jgi:hypothetical protein